MMARKRTSGVKRLKLKGDAVAIALTLKVDSETYMRLSVLRAKDRSTAQDILKDALTMYLDRKGV
jgi:predicted transcriptional regulator